MAFGVRARLYPKMMANREGITAFCGVSVQMHVCVGEVDLQGVLQLGSMVRADTCSHP